MQKNNNQSIIRGASAFFILLTHISAFTKSECILRAFTSFGYLWVGIFFFYTGYNLFNSYLKNSAFFSKFWFKKIIRIYMPLVISNILFVIIKTQLYGISYTNIAKIKNIIGITCINDNNWYIYAVLIFYFSAWLILKIFDKMKKFKNNKICLVITAICILILYGFLYYNIAMKLHLTTSIRNVFPLTLFFGIVYAIFKPKVLKILSNEIISELSIIFLFFASVTFHYANMNQINFFVFNVEIIDYLVPIFFTLLIMIVSSKINLNSRICKFIDSISLETYIFHYVILCLYSNPTFEFNSNYVYLSVYLLTVIVISYVVHNLTKHILDIKFNNINKLKI